MAKTLLQLINEVGKNMRLSTGSTYTTITQDADAIFINQAINEAKRMVEAERNWAVQHKAITFPTVAATQTYDTSDTGVVTSDPDVTNERSRLLTDLRGNVQFWDVTSGGERQMRRRPKGWVQREAALQTSTSDDIPVWFAIYPSGSGLTVEFPYTIASARNYKFIAYVPQADLAAAATELECPEKPVVMAATAIAAEERGEELGLDASAWWERYNSALSDAVIVDMFEEAEAVLTPV